MAGLERQDDDVDGVVCVVLFVVRQSLGWRDFRCGSSDIARSAIRRRVPSTDRYDEQRLSWRVTKREIASTVLANER